MKSRSWSDKKKQCALLFQDSYMPCSQQTDPFTYSRKRCVYRIHNVSNRLLLVGKAYNEPQDLCSYVENILLQRDFIID